MRHNEMASTATIRRRGARPSLYFAPRGTQRIALRARRSGPVVQDLFAGAGLFSYAFALEGYRLSRAVELDEAAASTYAQQLGPHIEVADIRSVAPSGRCDVLLAGPPCQGFSTLGRRRADDPRNPLSLEVVRWASILRPRVLVVENVASFVGSIHHARLLAGLEAEGYQTSVHIADATAFGVPQRRLRSFTFGSLTALPTLESTAGRVYTVRDAWDGLPASPDGRNMHVAPAPSPLALARIRLIPPGGDRRDIMRLAPELAPASWKSLGVNVTDAWGRMRWDQPSNTLRTMLQNPSKGRYVHPEQHRVISLREAARLHTIPDDWSFVGYREQVTTQIGNSVPPSLGRAIARAILAVL